MSRVKTLLLAVILVVGILFPTTTLASPGITVSITDAVLPVGSTGSVALSISGATEPVSCIDVDVSYDPAVVEVIDASGSDFDSLVSNIENGDGHTHLVAYVTSETGLTGTIKVADITLKRLGGESPLTLDVITLKDDDGEPLAYDVHNGQVSGAIGLTVSISEVTLASGVTGSVAVTISGVSSDRPVSSTTIDVSYDPAVVEVIDASGSDFDSLVSNIQNGLGYTRLVAYVTSETGLTGPIKVADITLKRLGGESALTLDVITLKDDDGEPIRFSAVDGRVIADDIPPTVITSPANGATGVAITTRVRATFSEAIDEGTLSFSLDGVDGSVSYSGTTATFTPSANLGYSTSYTASISASDLAGNPMVAPYSCTFTTGTVPTVPPAVATAIATSIGTTTATLNLSLTDLGTATSVRVSFEWGETTAYGNETTPQTMTSTGAFSSSLSGLSPDTTYHFRAKAVGDGTSYGIDRTFTTGTVPTTPPAVTTAIATSIGTTTATLNGSLTDLGTATSVSVSFDWGETSAYGNETTPQTMTSTSAFSFSLSGLSSGTTYHFRAKAVGDGTSYGIDRTFTTGTVPTVPPAVATAIATSIGTTTATLNGSLTDLGTATSVSVSFEWGETSAYGNETTPQTMTSTGAFSFSLSGLSSRTTYHFRAKAVGDGTSYGIDRAFTTRARGGGGGGAPSPAAPPAPPPDTTDVRGQVSDAGVFLESVTATSEDELCTLTIPEGTVGLTEELEPLTEITTLIMDEPPPPPEAANVIGLAYDLGPDGATFDPPITLTFSYDPSDIPEGIAEEDLAIAYYDQATGEWVELEDCVVDIENNTITASVSHFTTFTIIGAVTPPPPPPAPTPAAFSVSNLSVTPLEVQPKEAVTITASVANTGGMEGSYTIVLKINGVKEAEKTAIVAAGSSRDVSFTVTKEDAGSYSVTVDGLSASFTVVAPPEEEEVAPPEEEEEVPEVAPVNWPLIGGIIAAVVVVVGLIIFFLVRRRAQVTRQ